VESWLLLHVPTWLLGTLIVALCVGISLGVTRLVAPLVARGLLDADGYPVELAVLGLSGSGYVRVGGTGKTFTDGVTEVVNDMTQLVVVFGSINDGSSAPAEESTPEASCTWTLPGIWTHALRCVPWS